MHYRTCNPLYGWRWFSEGVRLFLAQPWPWLALVSVTLLGMVLLATLPVLGLIVVFLCFPGIAAGFMQVARDVAGRQPVILGHIVQGLRSAPKPLLQIGGVAFLGMLAGALFLTFAWREEFVALVELARSPTPDREAMEAAMAQLALPSVLTLILMLPVVMATWFAPALVLFRRADAQAALVHSFWAALRNLWPLLVLGVLMVLLDAAASFLLRTLLAALVSLGAGVVNAAAVLMSFPLLCAFVAILFGAAYTSYTDVFEAARQGSASHTGAADASAPPGGS